MCHPHFILRRKLKIRNMNENSLVNLTMSCLVMIYINMRGLTSLTSWRTFLTGLILGYILAWKIHRAAQIWSFDEGWIDQYVPVLTPALGRHD